MPDLDLDAIDSLVAEYHQADVVSLIRGEDSEYNERFVPLLVALVAEVRRLRAEVDGLKQTQTVGTATMLGPWSTREAPRKAPRGGRRGPA